MYGTTRQFSTSTSKIPAEYANVESVDGGPEIERLHRQICDVTIKDLLISQAAPVGSSSRRALLKGCQSAGALPKIIIDYVKTEHQLVDLEIERFNKHHHRYFIRLIDEFEV